MLLIARVLVIMQMIAIFRSPRVAALRLPHSHKFVQREFGSFFSRNRNVASIRTAREMRLLSTTAVDDIVSAIASKGNEIRELKASKAGKESITPLVAELLQLKTQF